MNNGNNSKPSCSSGSCSAKQCNSGKCDTQNKPRSANAQDEMIKDSLSKIKHKLFVMSGKGGVGKSSISANIAVTLAEKGYKVGLMDVDVHGPSIAQIMGLKGLLDLAENQQQLKPVSCGENLKVVSMQSLLQDSDQAVIWRGPAKSGMIQQFIGAVQWGDLDFLVIDSPPGTGDEPLTVAQTIPDAKAVVITTPQDVALADVRKSINFCKIVQLDILGLVENMGPFKCPGCGLTIELFKSGGGKATAEKMGIDFLGSVPFDPQVVVSCDSGKPITKEEKDNEFSKALDHIVNEIVKKI
jgi:Mrp family chromosome partitioning ATPase